MNPIIRVMKNAVANLLRGGVGALVAIVLPALLTRHMSTLAYGIWSLVLQVAAYVGYLDFGLQTAIGRYIAYANEKQDTDMRNSVFSTALAALCGACGISIIFLALAVALADHLFPSIPHEMLPSTRWALAIIGSSLALGLPASAWNGVFVGIQRNELPALTGGIAKVLSATVVCVLALNGYSLIPMACATGAVSCLSYAAQYLLFIRMAPGIRMRVSLVRRSSAKELSRYCFSLTIWSFCMLLVSGLDVVLVGYFDFTKVAAYAVAASLVTFVTGTQGALFSAMMPHAAVLHAKEGPSALGKLLVSSTGIGVILSMLTGVPLVLYAKPLLQMWLGGRYSQQASHILAVLLTAMLVRLVWVPYSIVLIGAGEQKVLTISPIVEGLSNLAFSLVLGYRFGAIGIAYGTAVGVFLGSIANLVYALPKSATSIHVATSRFVVHGIAIPSLVGLPFLYVKVCGDTSSLGWLAGAFGVAILIAVIVGPARPKIASVASKLTKNGVAVFGTANS